MVDTGDLKSLARKGVRVQVPPRAPQLFQAELDPACGCSGLPLYEIRSCRRKAPRNKSRFSHFLRFPYGSV